MCQLETKRKATKELQKLPTHVGTRVLSVIRELPGDPRLESAKNLQGVDAYSIRVGDYRIVYDIDDAAQVITVLRVRHRREVYKNL